jgi:hypothetical protein
MHCITNPLKSESVQICPKKGYKKKKKRREILKVLWSTGYRDVLKGADIARKTLWRLRRRMTTVLRVGVAARKSRL